MCSVLLMSLCLRLRFGARDPADEYSKGNRKFQSQPETGVQRDAGRALAVSPPSLQTFPSPQRLARARGSRQPAPRGRLGGKSAHAADAKVCVLAARSESCHLGKLFKVRRPRFPSSVNEPDNGVPLRRNFLSED